MVDDNDRSQLLSDDPFWAAIEAQFGPIALARRRSLEAVRLLSQARNAYLRATDDSATKRALELAVEVMNAAEIGADEDFTGQVAHSYRPEPPRWWRDRYRARWERLRPLQDEALKAIGVGEPIPPRLVSDHVRRLASTMKLTGRSQQVFFPPKVEPDPRDRPWEVLMAYSGLDAGDLALLKDQLGERYVDADVQYRAGSPLYRVARLEVKVAFELGCGPDAAGLFLLCDVMPDAPWITVSSQSVGMSHRYQNVVISVPSHRVSPRDVAGAYAAYMRATWASSPDAMPPTSPKSEWPSRLVAFVLAYRHEHGAHTSWAEMHEAWHDEHPNCPVYGSLQSFRNTFNRVNKQEEGRLTSADDDEGGSHEGTH